MKYFIDGHNLIPKIPGLSLSQSDDEDRLLELLREYARITRRSLTVFFDQAPDGHSGVRSSGTISVHYVNNRTTADEEIITCVLKSRPRTGEIVVVSSDRHVCLQCHSLGAKTLRSEVFSQELQQVLSRSESTGTDVLSISEAEVEEWLKLFSDGKK